MPVTTAKEKLPIREKAFRAMVCHLEACLPNEGVGLISVAQSESGMVGERFYAGRNTVASPTRYTMDPADVSAALRQMELRGTRLGAIVHSHPRTPPVPSRIDLAEAKLQEVLQVIVGFEPEVTVRGWRLLFDDRGVARQAIEVECALFPDPNDLSSWRSQISIAKDLISDREMKGWA